MKSRQYAHVHELADLNPSLLDEIEHFFQSYNAIKGKRFTPQGRYDAAEAHERVRAAMQAGQQRNAERA